MFTRKFGAHKKHAPSQKFGEMFERNQSDWQNVISVERACGEIFSQHQLFSAKIFQTINKMSTLCAQKRVSIDSN